MEGKRITGTENEGIPIAEMKENEHVNKDLKGKGGEVNGTCHPE